MYTDMRQTKKSTKTEEPMDLNQIPERLLAPVEPTLVANMDRVVELVTHLKLGAAFEQVSRPYLEYIAQRMSLTMTQALLMSLFLEKSTCWRIQISDFAEMIGCSTIRIISLMSDADVLVDRGLILRKKDREGSVFFRMSPEVVTAFKDNVVYVRESLKDLTAEQLFDRMEKIFDDYEQGDEILPVLRTLVDENCHLEYCKLMKKFRYDGTDLLLLYIFCNRFINEDDDRIGEMDWEDFYASKSTLRRLRGALKDQTHPLIKDGLIEMLPSEGLSDNFYKMTDKAKEMLFKELNISLKPSDQKDLVKHGSLAEKRLFYNSRERAQIDRLSELLMPDRFASVQQRLEENGMRKGFACLFHGSPGTGKTETVYQLARRTGRDLMVVDVSQIKSCWVGESEKNIKKAFDRYRDLVKECGVAPILLFNEADAVLGIRQEGAQRAVDKMENSIQNIILQEMEQLDGIMIATTNLTQNLDKAFERRFLYKIEFGRPSLEARKSIWQSMIPSMPDAWAENLAETYDFSGGQIENIARKCTVELILRGEEPDARSLHEMCRAELLSGSDTTRRRIGF